MKTIVVARNWRDYTDWCRDNDRHPHDRDMVFASSSSRVRGYSAPVELVVTSGGAGRSDLAAIRREIAFIEAVTA